MDKYLFLWSSPSSYFLKCIEALNGEVSCDVYFSIYDYSAPVRIDGIKVLNNMNPDEWINYDKIFVCGWINKTIIYKLLEIFKQKSNQKWVLCIDTPWKNTIRQKLFSRIFRAYFKKLFDAIWVAGEMQVNYAKQLGFGIESINKGYYAADTLYFKNFQNNILENINADRHNILLINRYAKEKNLELIWSFIKENKEIFSQIKWHIVGTGPLYDDRFIDENITHHGFLKQEQMMPIINQCSCFLLASTYEPWGVVVHEMAAAGMPMILSTEVNARIEFLDPTNGFLFSPNSLIELKIAINKWLNLSIDEKVSMSQSSFNKGNTRGIKEWIKTAQMI